MRIIACIKQVPDTTSVEIDEETGSLKREGVESKINIYDLYALKTAFEIREKTGATVTALSMGPPQAQQAIREALLLGADDGYLISDRRFAGSDVLATSYTLSQAVQCIGGCDLIICGKQTTDGDTAQVGPALAEHLGIPHAAWVSRILEADGQGLLLEQDLTDNLLRVKIEYPCLITVEKSAGVPGLPSYLRKRQFADVDIKVLRLADFSDQDPARYGADGSPTQVENIFPPEENTEKVMLEGTAEQLAADIWDILVRRKLI